VRVGFLDRGAIGYSTRSGRLDLGGAARRMIYPLLTIAKPTDVSLASGHAAD